MKIENRDFFGILGSFHVISGRSTTLSIVTGVGVCQSLSSRRRDAPEVAIFGGINFGDRFNSWRDFAVRLEGDGSVYQLISSLGWHISSSGDMARDDF